MYHPIWERNAAFWYRNVCVYMSFHQALQHPADIKQVSSITEYFTSKSASQVAAKILNLTRSRFAYTVSNLAHCTPLICALLMESFDCAALLIAAGADPTIPNKNGTLEILGMQTADRLLVGVVCYYLLNEFQFFFPMTCNAIHSNMVLLSRVGGHCWYILGPEGRRATHDTGIGWHPVDHSRSGGDEIIFQLEFHGFDKL